MKLRTHSVCSLLVLLFVVLVALPPYATLCAQEGAKGATPDGAQAGKEAGQDQLTLDKITPLVLLAAIWGAFSVVLKSFELMNSARDKIIDPTNHLPRELRGHILLAEYLPLRFGTFLFVCAFAVLLCWVPFEARGTRFILFIACFGVAVVSIAFCMGLVLFYWKDKELLEKIIKQSPDESRPYSVAVDASPTASK